jgi:TPR repeat protein
VRHECFCQSHEHLIHGTKRSALHLRSQNWLEIRIFIEQGAFRMDRDEIRPISGVASASRRGARLLACALALANVAASASNIVADGLEDFQHARFGEAITEWRQAADAGDARGARGALFLGVMYDAGIGVSQDYAQALLWYRRAAAEGSAAGAFNVGVLYDAGLGVAKSPAHAATWYAQAATQGFGRAEYNLGLLYEGGIGVPHSRKQALALFARAAGHGISAAKLHLAALGRPYAGAVTVGRETAMEQFQRAQALLLQRGPQESARAVALFQQAAAQHNALAEYDLGYCYNYGLGVKRDTSQAVGWYRRAASDAGDPALRSIALNGAQSAGGMLAARQ